MKTIRSLLLALVLFSLPAHADFRESNRTRVSVMTVTYASGLYHSQRAATLELLYGDSSLYPENMTFTTEGRRLNARIWKTHTSFCGDHFYARLFLPDERRVSDLELVDYSQVRCRLYVQHKWQAILTTQEPDGTESKMELVGDPIEN